MKKQRPEKAEAPAPTELSDQSRFRSLPWLRLARWGAIGLAIVAILWLIGDVAGTRFTLGKNRLASLSSDNSLQQSILRQSTNYRFAISYPDNTTKTYTVADAGMQVNANATVQALRHSQQSWSHLVHWWQPVPVKLQVSVNPTAQAAFITQHVSIVTAQAQDASLSISNGVAAITGGVAGKQYGLDYPSQKLVAVVAQLQTAPLRLRLTTLPPSQNDASLASAKAQLTTILNQHIDIHMGNQTTTPTNKDIASWIVITNGSKPTFSVDGSKVQDYLTQLAKDHSQPSQSQIVLSSTGQVIQSGVKGQTMSSNQSIVDAITSSLMQAKGTQVTLPVQYTAFQVVHAPTSGKWIEVNLTTKRMYAYDQGSLVRAFLVSAGAAATPTVTGQYAIYAKYPSQNMYGENANGTQYYQPNVPWVNYFYRDYAIHGNYWRPNYYFGSINSSHGCVGVPVSDGAWIYSWAPIGTPVIVHY
jgi:lipoprotein-anchoring transpeptidase ErfK/SrfK